MKSIVLAGGLFCLATSSHAATVSVAEGTVLLRDVHGNFKSIQTGTATINAGEKIVVRSGGIAVVSYGDACAVRLPSGIWTVNSAPPCKGSVTEIDFTSRMGQAGPPEGGGDMPIEASPSGAPNMTPWILGGLAVAGGVGIAIAVSNSGDNKDDVPPSQVTNSPPPPRDLPVSP